MAYFILRDCKKTGQEDRLKPDFQDIEDARINCKILNAGDNDAMYWVRADREQMSEIEILARKSLDMKPESVVIGHT